MNSKDHLQGSTGADGPGGTQDDVLESLFDHVSARKRAPQEDEKAVREALHAEWKDITRRKQRKTYFTYALAASVLFATVIGFNMFRQAARAPMMQQVAVVEKQSGNIFIHLADEESSASRRLANSSLYAGQVLSTAQDARLAVAMISGETIRIDENSSLVFSSGQEIELLTGRIYVDSNQGGTEISPDKVLQISTFAGTVRHLGTQYMTGIVQSSVAVSVREGKVLFAVGGIDSIAGTGEQIRVTGSGKASISKISTHGELWRWAESVTPEFSLDGKTAFDFIHWVGRETGHSVNFASDSVEQLAHVTELRGSIDLEPMRALDLILQTSDLEPVTEDGKILIRKRAVTKRTGT